MTIADTSRKAGPFVGDGQTVSFPFNFRIFSEDQLIVLRSSSASEDVRLSRGIDYRVDLNVNQDVDAGGNVILTSPLAQGANLAILSNVPYSQETIFRSLGANNPEQHNKSLDKLTALTQQLKEKLDRALTVPATQTKTPEQLSEELLSAQHEASIYASQAQQSAQRAEEYANDASIVVGIQDDVKTVADNIVPVKTTASNIDAVNTASNHINAIGVVASDFNGAIDQPNNHDFGIYGVDDIPQTTPVGGSISTVAENIEAVRVVSGAVPGLPEHYESIDEVAKHTANIDTVANHVTQVDTVATNIDIVRDAAGVVTDLNSAIERVEAAANTVEANQQGALDAATTAVQSRDSAQASATSANTSMVNAQNSENMAKAWATSSTKPDGVLESSKTYAERAAVSENNARTYAGNGAASANEAYTYAQNALASKTSAQQSATAAAQSASTATQKADLAGSSALSASTSASQASTSAAEAKTSETNAKASETNAKTSETNAAESEAHASQSANDAQASALSAQSAKTSAESANASAQQAKQDAEGLVGRAQSSVSYETQTLTEVQKAQARTNIGLGALATQGVDFGTWSN